MHSHLRDAQSLERCTFTVRDTQSQSEMHSHLRDAQSLERCTFTVRDAQSLVEMHNSHYRSTDDQ